MIKPPKPAESDIELFHKTVGKVKPVIQDKILVRKSRPKSFPARPLEDQQYVMEELETGRFNPLVLGTGDELLFKRHGIQNKIFRKLRAGQFTTESQLDLHGMTIETAKAALTRFLIKAHRKHYKCVKIIHGKGLRSLNNEPIIKHKLSQWLQQRKDVLAFCSARPDDGGTGAIYVIIKRL